MKSRMNYSVTVLATGFMVLLLLSLPLFWARFFCEFNLVSLMRQEISQAAIAPSGLVPPEFENDPNVYTHSNVQAIMSISEPVFLGIADYFEARQPGGRDSKIYYLNKDKEDRIWRWIYFDEKIGQIIGHYTYKERTPNGALILREVQLYAGPDGISEIADKVLGRFVWPIACVEWPQSPFILYDKQLHRFFKINFEKKTVAKGPELSESDIHKPFQIGQIEKGRYMLNLYWSPPFLKAPDEGPKYSKAIVVGDYSWKEQQYLLILDETGRIDLLDRETLEFVSTAGHLPVPESLFPSRGFVTPKDLLGYEVLPLSLRTDNKYRGMFAASLSREGTSMTLNVFDEKGSLINQVNTMFRKRYERRDDRFISTSKAVFWGEPGAPTLTISKFLLENLHPPILSLFSYFTANSIEAGAGHRALFVLPNSFIAMKGRDTSKHTTERFFVALLIILPSIILAIILAWRVGEDAAVVGLSENAKLFWKLATIAFGLAAYIIYRMTRPGVTLVTCANCGKMRRPDMDRCHRCGSKWQVPELTPPTWRVTD